MASSDVDAGAARDLLARVRCVSEWPPGCGVGSWSRDPAGGPDDDDRAMNASPCLLRTGASGARARPMFRRDRVVV